MPSATLESWFLGARRHAWLALVCVLAALAASNCAAAAQSGRQDYDLPDPNPILARIQGTDGIDTAARRYAASLVLFDVTRVLAGTFSLADSPPKLARSNQLYLKAQADYQTPIEKQYRNTACQRPDCPLTRFYETAWKLELDRSFQEQVLATVPSAARAKYFAIKDQKAAQIRRDAEEARARAAVEERAQAEAEAAAAKVAAQKERMGPLAKTLIWIGVGFVALVVLVVILIFFFGANDKDEGPPLSTVYGSAAFGGVRATLDPPDAYRHGVFLGKVVPSGMRLPIMAPGPPVFTAPPAHTLIVAPSRTGKGTRVIIPTLLRYAGSALIIDPKGENAAVTARARQISLGQAVHIINPWIVLNAEFAARGFAEADTINPLDILDRNDPNVVNVAMALAAAICPTVDERQRYWSGNAASLIGAICLWLTDQPGEEKTLTRLRHILTLSRREFNEKFLPAMTASRAFDSAIAELLRPFEGLDDKPYSEILATATEATRFLSDPQIKRATATSTVSFNDLVAGRATVYLVIPVENVKTHATWLRLVITAALQTFKQRNARAQRGRCLFLIDEFPALGPVAEIPQDIATIAGFGVDMALVVQNLGQVRANYGDASAETILGNCAWKWFCNVGDLATAKHVAESLGKATVRTRTKTKTTSAAVAGAPNQTERESESDAFGETGRFLLTPEEIMTLGSDRAVVLRQNGAPLLLRPVDYWMLTTAFMSLQKNFPGLYWEPPLQYDRNPYSAAEDETQENTTGQSRSRQQTGGGAGRGSPRMNRETALDVLGLAPDATPDQIRKAFKRLMAKVHPDKEGGSNHLAKLLNEARDVLLPN